MGGEDGKPFDRGPEYNTYGDDEQDVLGTLRSAKIAEDFYGLRHPNRFTGEFSAEGEHEAHPSQSGKGAFKNNSGLPKEMIGTPI